MGWSRPGARGDEEGFFQRVRVSLPKRPICLPVAHSSPSVDGNGVVFIGHASGLFIGVKDWNKDGKISDEEVSTYDTEAAYLHSGPAFAPGMRAVTTCDSLWVWKWT